jgi:hypothetical protein
VLTNDLTSKEKSNIVLPPLKKCGRPRTRTDEESLKDQERMRRYFYKNHEAIRLSQIKGISIRESREIIKAQKVSK